MSVDGAFRLLDRNAGHGISEFADDMRTELIEDAAVVAAEVPVEREVRLLVEGRAAHAGAGHLELSEVDFARNCYLSKIKYIFRYHIR